MANRSQNVNAPSQNYGGSLTPYSKPRHSRDMNRGGVDPRNRRRRVRSSAPAGTRVETLPDGTQVSVTPAMRRLDEQRRRKVSVPATRVIPEKNTVGPMYAVERLHESAPVGTPIAEASSKTQTPSREMTPSERMRLKNEQDFRDIEARTQANRTTEQKRAEELRQRGMNMTLEELNAAAPTMSVQDFGSLVGGFQLGNAQRTEAEKARIRTEGEAAQQGIRDTQAGYRQADEQRRREISDLDTAATSAQNRAKRAYETQQEGFRKMSEIFQDPNWSFRTGFSNYIFPDGQRDPIGFTRALGEGADYLANRAGRAIDSALIKGGRAIEAAPGAIYDAASSAASAAANSDLANALGAAGRSVANLPSALNESLGRSFQEQASRPGAMDTFRRMDEGVGSAIGAAGRGIDYLNNSDLSRALDAAGSQLFNLPNSLNESLGRTQQDLSRRFQQNPSLQGGFMEWLRSQMPESFSDPRSMYYFPGKYW